MKYLINLILFLGSFSLVAQTLSTEELTKILLQKDSLIFDRAFNNCETEVLEDLISQDATFYHDQAGITEGKDNFIESIKHGICGGNMPYKPSRVLDKASHQVFPMYDNGTLYAAIQTGKHRFYAKEVGKEKYFTSVADFTHLWQLEEGVWRLKNVLSYNHLTSETNP